MSNLFSPPQRSSKRRSLPLFVFCWLVFGLVPSSAHAVDFVWILQSGLRFEWMNNGINQETSPLTFGKDQLGANFLFGAVGMLEFNQHVTLTGTFDVGEISLGQQTLRPAPPRFAFLLNGFRLNLSDQERQQQQEATDACKAQVRDLNQKAGTTKFSESECVDPFWLLLESSFIRELYATFYLDAQKSLKLDVGVQNAEIGRAFVYDNYAIGIRFVSDWSKRKDGPPLKLTVHAFLPDASWTAQGKHSPVGHAEISWLLDKKDEEQKLGFFVTYMYDGDNYAGRLLLPLWREEINNKLNESWVAQTGENPGYNCFSPIDKTAIQASFSAALQRVQTACEKNNQGKALNQQQACPVDIIQEHYYDQVCSTYPQSTGHHTWLGLQGKKKWGPFTLEGAAIFYLSWMRFAVPEISKKPSIRTVTATRRQSLESHQSQEPSESEDPNDFVPTVADTNQRGFGFLGELKATMQWNPIFSTSAYFLYASGGAWSNRAQVSPVFMGIAPQVRYSNIFFNGGINAYSSRRGVDISGLSGRGYITPGLLFRVHKEEKFDFKLNALLLWANAPPVDANVSKGAGQFYGAEINFMASYTIFPWLKPVLQTDFFVPGDFFNNEQGQTPGLVFRLLVGVDFIFPEK
ncbi:MAG: hypothetical protein H6727_01000 [Myxococcales bacterium]|nr:hypothetical protein [Myxococcales bacterium]